VTRIPAKVISVARQDGKYCVTVGMRRIFYKGSFETLAFGENRPTVGSSRNGRLHLIYGQDPGLEEGKAFPCGPSSELTRVSPGLLGHGLTHFFNFCADFLVGEQRVPLNGKLKWRTYLVK
jgi:hypothetical protein